MELERPQPTAQMFVIAKDVLGVALGPRHVDSIEACQSLAYAYSAMGNYSFALKFQQKVINAWGSHGSSDVDELREATRLLDHRKKKVFAPITKTIAQDVSDAIILPPWLRNSTRLLPNLR